MAKFIRMEKRGKEILRVESPEIFMINFAGRKTDSNPNGHRQFSLKLPSIEYAEQMKEEGWSVWYTKESERYGDATPCITVEMRWQSNPELKWLNPKIYKCTRKNPNGTLIPEELIDELENDEIEDIVLDIRLRYWTINGKSGIKAYVDSMWLKIEDDDPSGKFWGYDEVEELPYEE